MKRFISLILLLFIGIYGPLLLGQNESINALKKKLDNSEGEEKLILLAQITKAFLSAAPQKSIHMAALE